MLSEISFEQNSSEPVVKVFVPMYEPLEVTKCKKSGNVIGQ